MQVVADFRAALHDGTCSFREKIEPDGGIMSELSRFEKELMSEANVHATTISAPSTCSLDDRAESPVRLSSDFPES